jgi:teichoic acid transport system permease protein
MIKFIGGILGNRKLILELSRNDFKKKYAGSYLGMIWAFIQPVVTVLVYWFVFEKGLRSGQDLPYPFVLWLIAGLVPWFFFSDGWNGGTSSLLEYQYLVKKVVFQIDILPVVKELAALYVHGFFVLFTLVLYACYGYYPNLYMLQILYYSFCAFVLVMGLSYLTSAIVVFFRDLTQIIGILLQIGIWVTPIMWNMDTLADFPDWLKFVFRLNPMYYIVSGYRDAMLNETWFWQHGWWTLYFWAFALVCLLGGTGVFRKLKVHFADVL